MCTDTGIGAVVRADSGKSIVDHLCNTLTNSVNEDAYDRWQPDPFPVTLLGVKLTHLEMIFRTVWILTLIPQ